MPVLTNRPIAANLDAYLNIEDKVLDHGFVRVIDYMGNDEAIVQAARVSYGTGTKSLSKDQNLINYLMQHRHTTPFEMCEIKFHVKLPIFVARQWIRHRTANVNEYSARYSILDKEFYIPEVEQIALQSETNKQGRGVHYAEAQHIQWRIQYASEEAYGIYEGFNNLGLARELSRMVLPVNYYTQWYWKVNLHNLLNFLSLRADPHAQWEIRVYAEKMLDIVKMWCPLAHAAFLEHRMNANTFSASAMRILRTQLQGQLDQIKFDAQESGLRQREIDDLIAALTL